MNDRPPPPARVRVTAPRRTRSVPSSTGSRPAVGRETGSSDVDSLFVRSLIRSQLRLALACALGFVALLALFALLIAFLPEIDAIVLWGVPLSWLLLGFGVYPLVIAVAALYVRAAGRNEARYRSLAEES